MRSGLDAKRRGSNCQQRQQGNGYYLVPHAQHLAGNKYKRKRGANSRLLATLLKVVTLPDELG